MTDRLGALRRSHHRGTSLHPIARWRVKTGADLKRQRATAAAMFDDDGSDVAWPVRSGRAELSLPRAPARSQGRTPSRKRSVRPCRPSPVIESLGAVDPVMVMPLCGKREAVLLRVRLCEPAGCRDMGRQFLCAGERGGVGVAPGGRAASDTTSPRRSRDRPSRAGRPSTRPTALRPVRLGSSGCLRPLLPHVATSHAISSAQHGRKRACVVVRIVGSAPTGCPSLRWANRRPRAKNHPIEPGTVYARPACGMFSKGSRRRRYSALSPKAGASTSRRPSTPRSAPAATTGS